MSNRSYPAGFARPLREVPVATDEDVQRMLKRLRRRCKIGKTSSQQAHEEARPRVELSLDFNDNSGELKEPKYQAQLPDGAKPSPPAVANIDAASSAGQPSPAGSSVVSGGAAITATAGGGSNGAEPTGSFPFQPTRPAPDSENRRSPSLVEESKRAERPALHWVRLRPEAMGTICRTWTCCKVTVCGHAHYELWRRIAGLERPVCVKRGLSSFLQAQAIAQDEMHADNGLPL